MRRSYEEDKKKLETRVAEEKLRTDKRYNELLDEYEAKFFVYRRIQDKDNQAEEEEENHKEELQGLEIQMYNLNQNYQTEVEIKNNQIDISEGTIRQITQQLEE